MSDPAKTFRVGLIGTGRISDIYLRNIKGFAVIDITACGSLNMDESHAKAAEHGVPRVSVADGANGVRFIDACVRSNENAGAWVQIN